MLQNSTLYHKKSSKSFFLKEEKKIFCKQYLWDNQIWGWKRVTFLVYFLENIVGNLTGDGQIPEV